MPTRAEYRRAIAYALSDMGVYLTTSATSTTLTILEISDSTTGASANRYDGRWVYVATGSGQAVQRRVKTGGFDAEHGILSLELSWLAPVSGDQIEITSLFPADQQIPHEDASYEQIVNRALSLLLVPDRITIAVTANDDAYPVTTWPWLTPARLVRALEPSPVSTRSPIRCDWRGVRIVEAGTAPYLQIDAPFTGTLTLEVLRPGHTLISGTESTAGLTNEAQTALPSVEDVRTVGLMVAAELMMARSAGRPDGVNWAARYADYREQAMQLRYFDRTVSMPVVPTAEAA